MLTDEQIKELLKEFIKSNTYSKYHAHRIKRHEFNSKWINQESIRSLSDDELRQKFIDYYKNGEGRQTFNQIYRDRIIRDVTRFRSMLLCLLDETIPIKERFEKVVEGTYHIEGVGKGLASAFLMDFNMNIYCLWNNKTDMGLNVIGWKVYKTGDDIGTKYVKVLESLKKLRDDIAPELKLTFDDIDFFLHFISAEDEGIDLVQNLTGEKEIEVSSPSEKFVQKILEDNFNDVIGNKLGLEVYQEDPENPGIQYPTSVGKIDFLTRDRSTGDFVVIELKCGKASDNALGQILRYMGWVKDNLAKDKMVRGLIIAEGSDEKLNSALKVVQNVEVLTFKILIQIEKEKS